MYLRAAGKSVMAAGRRDTTAPTLVKSCDRYIYLDDSAPARVAADKTTSRRTKQAGGPSLLTRAVEASVDESGQVVGSKLYQTMLRIDPSFNFKGLGHRTFRQFLKDSKEVQVTQPSEASDVVVQLTQAPTPTPAPDIRAGQEGRREGHREGPPRSPPRRPPRSPPRRHREARREARREGHREARREGRDSDAEPGARDRRGVGQARRAKNIGPGRRRRRRQGLRRFESEVRRVRVDREAPSDQPTPPGSVAQGAKYGAPAVAQTAHSNFRCCSQLTSATRTSPWRLQRRRPRRQVAHSDRRLAPRRRVRPHGEPASTL